MTTPLIDTHVHVLWPERFPYPEGPGYKPSFEVADPATLVALMAEHGISHALLVQPGGYAFDNRPMIETMQLHPGKFKAIGAFPLETGRAELREANAQGIVGVRLNLFSFDAAIFQKPATRDFLKACHDEDLFVEVFAPSAYWPEAAPILRESGVKLIIEHMGWPDLKLPLEQEGFTAMLELASLPEVAVKLSCAFRMSSSGFPYADVAPFARRVVERFGIERCLWGSDWPFLGYRSGVSLTEELDALSAWVPATHDRVRVLRDNPARIFGFE